MLYLIEYDRDARRLVRLEEFLSSSLGEADNARLELELALNRQGLHHEVVILEASSEEALRRTHSRYFADLTGIAHTADIE